MDSRPIGYIINLWIAFDCITATTVALSRLHRAFDNSFSNQRNCQSEYQRERFGSLHRHFTSQIISSPQEELVCLTFSVKNVSHNRRTYNQYIRYLYWVLCRSKISFTSPFSYILCFHIIRT